MPFLYETHLHTLQGSACGRSTGAEHVRHYHKLGYAGVIVTDHFFGGNTAVPRDMPWKDRVEQFCSGYEDALQEGQKCGLQVFFGWEQTFEGDDYLVYGLDKQWLLEHPEVEGWNRADQLREVDKAGGAVIQAHPFRERGYITHVRLGRQFVHGVEVANAGNEQQADAAAIRYARRYGMFMSCGSDNHSVEFSTEHPERVLGVELDKPLSSIRDWVNIIRSKQQVRLHVPQSRFAIPDPKPFIHAYWMDENEDIVPTGVDWLAE